MKKTIIAFVLLLALFGCGRKIKTSSQILTENSTTKATTTNKTTSKNTTASTTTNIVTTNKTITVKTTTTNKTTNTSSKNNTTTAEVTQKRYGAFLGASSSDLDKICQYDIVSIEFDEFSASEIAEMKEKEIKIFAYLNVGAVEEYRDYYETFKSYTFAEYENWEEEAWMDVTNTDWQAEMKRIAESFKEKGADGVYMDNVDVYSVAKENSQMNDKINLFYSGLKKIIEDVDSCGLDILMNGGSEFLEEAIEKEDAVVEAIYAYHQEEVFSSILDYEENIFGEQGTEDSQYYREVIEKAYEKGMEIYLLEYTIDQNVINKIKDYCGNKYYYYCANAIELN